MVTRNLFSDDDGGRPGQQPAEQHGHPSYVCTVCNRGLSDPVSVKAGMGRICRQRAGAAGARDGSDGGGNDDPRTVAELPFDPATGDVICERLPENGRPVDQSLCTRFNINQTVVHHSPTGFEWGYGGSGPADFALNVLQLYVPKCTGGEPIKCYSGTCSVTAWGLHHDFKREVIAALPKEGGTIPGDLIRGWLINRGVKPSLIKYPEGITPG